MSILYCFTCGEPISSTAQFCNRCGSSTDESERSLKGGLPPLSLPEKLSIGRTADNEIQLDRPYVSKQHATLRKVEGGYQVQDHKSMAGTYINGIPVRGSAVAQPGDHIGIGTCDFRVADNLALRRRDLEGKLFLEAWNLSYRTKLSGSSRELIHDVSMVATPGQLLQVAGRGSQLLLELLAGTARRPPNLFKRKRREETVRGEIWLNTHRLDTSPHMRSCIGFASSDSHVLTNLTPLEALNYEARLRLPKDYAADELEQRIRSVLSTAGVPEHLWHQRIGPPQAMHAELCPRELVNLALALVADPDVLIVQLPTSGTNSTDEHRLVRTLRELANTYNKTIIFSSNQLRRRVLKMVDRLAVLDNRAGPSRLVYFGPAYGEKWDVTEELPECAARYFNEEKLKEIEVHDKDPEWSDVLEDPHSIWEGLRSRPPEYWVSKFEYEQLDEEQQRQARQKGLTPGWGTNLRRRLLDEGSVHQSGSSQGRRHNIRWRLAPTVLLQCRVNSERLLKIAGRNWTSICGKVLSGFAVGLAVLCVMVRVLGKPLVLETLLHEIALLTTAMWTGYAVALCLSSLGGRGSRHELALRSQLAQSLGHFTVALLLALVSLPLMFFVALAIVPAGISGSLFLIALLLTSAGSLVGQFVSPFVARSGKAPCLSAAVLVVQLVLVEILVSL